MTREVKTVEEAFEVLSLRVWVCSSAMQFSCGRSSEPLALVIMQRGICRYSMRRALNLAIDLVNDRPRIWMPFGRPAASVTRTEHLTWCCEI